MPKTSSRSRSKSRSRSATKSMKVPNLLKNPISLWVLAIIAAAMIINYVAKSQFTSLLVILAVGFLSTMFTKNMVITLLIAVGVTLLFRQFGGIREGMEGEQDNGNDKKENKKRQEASEEAAEEEGGESAGKNLLGNQPSTNETLEMMRMQERLLDKAEAMAPRVEQLMNTFSNSGMPGLKKQ